MKNKFLALVALSAFTPMTAMAATDGTLGTSSTGTVGLTVERVAAPVVNVQITGLEDIDFGTAVGDAPFPDNQNVTISNICVFMDSLGTYAIEVTPGTSVFGDPNSGSIGDWLYGWTYSDTDGNSTTASLGAGFTPSAVAGCSGTPNASLNVAMYSGPAATGLPAQVSTSSITLTVSPE